MWFSLFTTVLVLAITFYLGLQGLFSSLILCIMSILSAALAFGIYEGIYFDYLIDRQSDYGRAIALMAIFIVSLLVLRTVADALITGNLQFPVYVDRAGGGVFGFIAAMIIVGMLAIGFQMLPFGVTLLGFSRYALLDSGSGEPLKPDIDKNAEEKDKQLAIRMFRPNLDWSKVKQERRNLWLRPDSFTAGLVSYFSSGALAGQTPLKNIYPDFIGSIHRARAGMYRESRQAVIEKAIRVERYWDLNPVAFYDLENVQVEGKPMVKPVPCKEKPEPGFKRIVVRVIIAQDARDPDNHHRFTTEQVRLLARDRKGGVPNEYFLTGISSEKNPRMYIALANGEGVARQVQGANDTFDFVFVVPEQFEPMFIEYKQNARVKIQPSSDTTTDKRSEKPDMKEGDNRPSRQNSDNESKQPERDQPRITPRNPDEDQDRNTRTEKRSRGDRVSGLGPSRKGESFFSNKLPFDRPLTDYGGNIEAPGGKIEGGQLTARLDDDWQPKQGNRPPIDTFEVPPDMRLLQLDTEKLQPQSWLGNIMGQTVDKVGNFYLVDSQGKKYMPVGSYAMAKVGGQPTFDLIFLDETQRIVGHLPKFDYGRIKRSHLKGEYALYFLFHLPPGTRPVELETGRRPVDLKFLNLVAPE